jgi:hypothetical protein
MSIMPRATSHRNLATLNPKVAAEWHPEKNGTLTPLDVTSGSHKKVWWTCQKGHEWRSIISNRARLGRGCPICAGQKVTTETSLATKNPKLAKEWHPTKNGELTPHDVMTGSSSKKIWWLCRKRHEWKSIVKIRSAGAGCPYCAGIKASKANNLLSQNPRLAQEWHPTKNGATSPDQLTPRSGKMVWWACKKGHEYKCTVDNRGGGKSCPYCSNKRVFVGNCLKTVRPDLAREWHPSKNGKLTPESVTPGSSKKAWWVCKKGHAWHTTIASRSKSGCPKCHSQTSAPELRIYTELKHVFPDTVHRKTIGRYECDVFLPSLNIALEYDGEYWHRNKTQKDLKKNRALMNNGITLIRIREKGLEKLGTLDITADPSKSTGKPLIDAILKKIRLGSGASPHTSSKINRYLRRTTFANNSEYIRLLDRLPSAFPGNSFADHYPAMAEEWHPSRNGSLTASDITRKSNKRIWWQCRDGHEWNVTANCRANKSGCPYCAGQRATDKTSLATRNPDLAKEWHPTKNGDLTPKDVTEKSSKKVWWRCKHGHEYMGILYNKSKGQGCPYCSGRRASKTNCLAATYPKLALEWHPLKNGPRGPEHFTPGSHKKVWWKNRFGREWQAAICARVRTFRKRPNSKQRHLFDD